MSLGSINVLEIYGGQKSMPCSFIGKFLLQNVLMLNAHCLPVHHSTATESPMIGLAKWMQAVAHPLTKLENSLTPYTML